MTKQTEALRMAIEALETAEIQSEYDGLSNLIFKSIQACKEALAETQEPVLYIDGGGLDGHATWAQAIRCQDTDIALYTTPSREWVELSEAEISELWYKSQNDVEGVNLGFTTQEHFFAGMIEAKLREKNELFGNSG